MGLVKQKHPHERGEDAYLNGNEGVELETPPRAWGRPFPAFRHGCACRNTPTSVGKTTTAASGRISARKHPHERGEDPVDPVGRLSGRETPPRAWGRRHALLAGPVKAGNTPTSVGKTPLVAFPAISSRKHPHERGEDAFASATRQRIPETPPRAWGRHRHQNHQHPQRRNTPTSVGKTRPAEAPAV